MCTYTRASHPHHTQRRREVGKGTGRGAARGERGGEGGRRVRRRDPTLSAELFQLSRKVGKSGEVQNSTKMFENCCASIGLG